MAEPDIPSGRPTSGPEAFEVAFFEEAHWDCIDIQEFPFVPRMTHHHFKKMMDKKHSTKELELDG